MRGNIGHVVFRQPVDHNVGGASLLTAGPGILLSEFDGLGIDFTYPIVGDQCLIRDTVTAANNYRGAPVSKLTYTSPATKRVRTSGGVLTATAANALPYEWDATGAPLGILIEEARTNLHPKSQEFTTTDYSPAQGTLASDVAVAPDGTTTADSFTENTAGGASHGFADLGGDAVSYTTGTTYTGSIFAKYVSRQWIQMRGPSGRFGTLVYANYDIQNGVLGTVGSAGTATISYFGNGWYRCTLTGPCTSTGLDDWGITHQASGTDGRAAAFTGTSSVAYFWGLQVEAGAFATSYIPTTTGTATRAVDNISLATSLIPFSATVGTLYAKFRPINTSVIRFAMALDDATANERFAIGSSAAAAGLFTVIDGGAAQTAPLTAGTTTAGLDSKIAVSWAANDFAICTNGSTVALDTAGTLPTVTSLRFGTATAAASLLNGWLSEVCYIKRTMSDTELIARATS